MATSDHKKKATKKSKGVKATKKVVIKKPTTTLKTKLESHYTEEAVFALCGPIGSPIHEVGEKLRLILINKYKYDDAIIIRIGNDILGLGQKIGLNIKMGNSSRYETVKSKIDVANSLREAFGNGFLAENAIEKIYKNKLALETGSSGGELKVIVTTDEDVKVENGQQLMAKPKEKKRVAYIIDSIKTEEEYNTLKQVYRDLLYFIGVFSSKDDRITCLKEEFNDEKGDLVYNIIDEDSGEEIKHGINVKDTFPKADFFIRVNNRNHSEIDIKLQRFLNLVYDSEIVIPTPKETAMYLAASAAKNSACLSRQVGAALTDEKGEIISVGWNDVPKFGGDLYKSPLSSYNTINSPDNRCFKWKGQCFNDQEKNLMVDLIFEKLNKAGLLIEDKKNTQEFKNALDKLGEKYSADTIKKNGLVNIKAITKYVLRESKIKSLVEFSRSIHAEMHAIIIGSQLAGTRVKNGKLFITTYPCHNCARHIIVAGIKDIYYIEPYTKSLTMKLHRDAITEDENETNKVRILLFEGIGPNRYLELFEMKGQRKEKNTGKMIIKGLTDKPKTAFTLIAVSDLEEMVVKHFNEYGKE